MKKALMWKLLERFGVQGIQFVLQVVLARILDPSHYGALSLMIIFTTLANVFVQQGFNTALIQNKNVTEEDYSSVFWVSLFIAIVLYITLFFGSPYIAAFFKMPYIVRPFRILSLMVIPGAYNSVQIAKVSRELDFKKVFIGNIWGIIISGATGIILALLGAGLWALVVQTLLNITATCIVMFFIVEWRPRFIFNIARIKVLFAYGWKLLVSTLIDTLYQDIQSLVIGRRYDSTTLAYFNRGKQFPQFLIGAVNGAVQSVMLPTMAKRQDDYTSVKQIMRKTIVLSAYVIFPTMAGLAGIAKPLVIILLTDKWLPCVPYLQIFCFNYAFWPVHTCNLQAINAMGRSDIFLKLEIIKKTYGIAALIIALIYFRTPLAIAATGAITTLISCFVNAFPNKKIINYSFTEQIKDIVPSFFISLAMFGGVVLAGRIHLTMWLVLLVQIVVGISTYISLSIITKSEPYYICLKGVKSYYKRKIQIRVSK